MWQVAVGGSSCLGDRRRWAAGAVARCADERRVLGYCVAGLGTSESDGQQSEMIAASLEPVPTQALRMASGVSTPHQACEALCALVCLLWLKMA